MNVQYARLSTEKNDTVRMEVYETISDYYSSRNADSAFFYVDKGYSEFAAINFKPGIATMYAQRAVLFSIASKADEAAEQYNKALVIFKELKHEQGIAMVSSGLGVLEGKKGNYAEATRSFMAALKGYEHINDSSGLQSTYMKLGIVNEHIGNMEQALEYYRRAETYQGNRPMDRISLALLNNIGVLYGKKREMPKAIGYFEKAMNSADRMGYKSIELSSLISLGMVYNDMGIPNMALHYFDKALVLTKAEDMPDSYATVLVNRASVFAAKDPKRSLADLKEALAIARRIDQKLLLLDIYDDMMDLYVAGNDYEHALDALHMKKNLSDTIYNTDKAKEIANLQSAYELERSRSKIKELQVQSKRNDAKNKFIVIVASVLVIMILLVLVLYKKSKKLNLLLAERERELEKTDKIKDKLFSVIGHDLRGPIGAIPVMLQLLKGHDETAEERTRMMSSMTDHAVASVATLDKLLYWGQSQIKGVGVKPELFNATPYVQANLKLIKSSAEQKNITIENDIPTDVLLYADTAHFDFILRNLLSNAVKFTYRGGRVRLSADAKQEEGFIVFAVSDNGIGISKADGATIFDPFASTVRGTANEKGNSIGLMLCRDFVRENGGRIWMESEEGNGSVFYFSMKKG